MFFSFAALLLASAAGGCGEVVTIRTHGGSTTRYALAHPRGTPAKGERTAIVLLPGGGGSLDLDGAGCPRALRVPVLVVGHAADRCLRSRRISWAE